MSGIKVALLDETETEWLESEFNARWPWPRPAGFVASLYNSCPHFVARDSAGRYLGHCHVRESRHMPFLEAGIPEVADLSVMPDCRRQGAASALLDAVEAHVASTSRLIGIAVGVYDAYGPAQRLYALRDYVPDGTGAWAGANNLMGGESLEVDDDLVLYLTKTLR